MWLKRGVRAALSPLSGCLTWNFVLLSSGRRAFRVPRRMVVLSALFENPRPELCGHIRAVSARHKLSLRSDCMDSRAPRLLPLALACFLKRVALEVFNDSFVLAEKTATSELRLEAALFSCGEAMMSASSLKLRGG